MVYIFKSIPKIKFSKWNYNEHIVDSDVPLLISYPRSGSHWLNALFEIYFDRIHGPNRDPIDKNNISWVKRKNPSENYMWNHIHDKSLLNKSSNSELGDIFLIRNPTHAIYSLSLLEGNEKSDIIEYTDIYKKLFEKWINNCKTVLIYEYAVKDPYKCIQLISNHFEIPYNEERAKLAVEICTKEAILGFNTKYHNQTALTEQYKNGRIEFEKKYGPIIRDIVTTNITKYWLEKIYRYNIKRI